jgi:hypothetical protein
MRDLTLAMPEDGETYATSLIIRENPPQKANAGTGGKTPDPALVTGQLYGKTSDQPRVQQLLDRLRRSPAFTEVKLGGTQDSPREREVSFSITFTYLPPKAAQ